MNESFFLFFSFFFFFFFFFEFLRNDTFWIGSNEKITKNVIKHTKHLHRSLSVVSVNLCPAE